jgi:hypothetical protein
VKKTMAKNKEEQTVGLYANCKDLGHSYSPLKLKGQVKVETIENSRYAINGKLLKAKKGYERGRIGCI